MIRKIIRIDEEKCNGCGVCASACHEGAIGMINGKAKLLREDYCDGLGDCLPACPANAISFEEREALAYDAAAVEQARQEKFPCGCPGSAARSLPRSETYCCSGGESALRQWPVQIKLMPLRAPYYEGANLLIAADCSAYAAVGIYGHYAQRYVLAGCGQGTF